VGQSVILSADAYPNVTYHGKVFGLNAGTGAAFSLLPPQNATGNWIKIVQRLPVRIWLNPEELKHYPLRLGLSMHVTTNIRPINGNRLRQKTETKPIYSTYVYAQQMAKANQLINTILLDNAPNMFIPRIVMNG
jgi:membrane fusion protein (multidrug efflux system)